MTLAVRLAGAAALLAAAEVACSAPSGLGAQPQPDASSGQPAPDAQRAGARLVPWTLEADGLDPVAVGILDRQENIHCQFMHATDGRLRCLPRSQRTLDPGIFSDAACTSLAHVVFNPETLGRDAPLVSVPLPVISCEPQRFEVRRLRAFADGEPLFLSSDGRCVPFVSEIPAAIASELLPAERWAAGEEVDGARLSERLRVRDVTTAGGARFADHLVDDRWNRTCELQPDGCWPPSVDGDALFADDGCTTPLFPVGRCTMPVFVRQGGPDHVFAFGPRWNGPVFRQGKGCFPGGPSQDADGLFLLGPQLDREAVAAAPLVVHGGGRLQAPGFRTGDGTIVSLPRALLPYQDLYFQDTVTRINCAPVWTRSGEVRCVDGPLEPHWGPAVFADAACAVPAFYCFEGHCAGRDVVRFTYADGGEKVDAQRVTEVRDLDMTQPFVRVAGKCVEGTMQGKLATWGAEAPWDAFPVLRERNGLARP